MTLLNDRVKRLTRRSFLGTQAGALGQIALASLLLPESVRAERPGAGSRVVNGLPHFAASAKRVMAA